MSKRNNLYHGISYTKSTKFRVYGAHCSILWYICKQISDKTCALARGIALHFREVINRRVFGEAKSSKTMTARSKTANQDQKPLTKITYSNPVWF